MNRLTVLLSLTPFFVGCADALLEPTFQPLAPPDARPFVEGAALSALDAEGHFSLPPGRSDGTRPIVGEEQAAVIAAGVLRTFFSNRDARGLGQAAERQHGGPIEWARAKPGPRLPYFAESHLEPLPDSFREPAARHFGPQYMVPIFVDETPVAVVVVAAHATNLFFDESGLLQQSNSSEGGGEFRISGIPWSLEGLTMPLSPEDAVRFAFGETGQPTVQVPVLGVPGNNISPAGARWEIELAAPVSFERVVDGASVTASRVFVGTWCSAADVILGGPPGCILRMRLFVAADQQPTQQDIGEGLVPLRPGFAVDVHEVRVR